MHDDNLVFDGDHRMMIFKMAGCLFLMTRWQCLVIFQNGGPPAIFERDALWFPIWWLTCSWRQHGSSVPKIIGITFPCRGGWLTSSKMMNHTYDLKIAAHLLMLVRWLMMPNMGAHFILLRRWLMISKMAGHLFSDRWLVSSKIVNHMFL